MSVSDQVGKGGIADQMIRFNGYPFLEKDDAESGDKGFNEPIAHIMRKDLVVIPSTGLPLSELQRLVQGSSFQGFPVVATETDRTIIGFIPKNELRFALDRVRRSYALSPDTYVDETPLTVSPKMPLEIVLQLFRRMGPRVILVQSEGQLQGLVTIKDVLRHEATEKHREAAEARELRELRRDSTEGWGEWTPLGALGDAQGPVLEHALESGLNWAQTRGVGVVNDVIARVRAARPGSAGGAVGSRGGLGMSGDAGEGDSFTQDYSFAIGDEEEARDEPPLPHRRGSGASHQD
ncbi:voltage-gated chloride channel [Trichosporon asahii var. asahii CBS 2479]|uniref:Voltage-gated chloride channel n=1 Tax=Trichosporon asahii var. asahii (strain ATCC 90039 / CBS 2479 / JCM 2466 / KCTC 7840 / NBRC 103889/ NCYC 2677 / UAMH 7654) TaxID=1186058 RepID=J6ESC0_TRIAS|nr:voltage-gated chloride channel [Trichosporon asahii var. asahii CBS 2479]EJT47429.1 voltage-gated chloride channel [Trichosporon asahii var. asahii CBS 2479]